MSSLVYWTCSSSVWGSSAAAVRRWRLVKSFTITLAICFAEGIGPVIGCGLPSRSGCVSMMVSAAVTM